MTDTFPYVIGIVNFSSVTWGWDGLYKETIIVSVRQRELPLMTELALASFRWDSSRNSSFFQKLVSVSHFM